MPLDTARLPTLPALVRVMAGGHQVLAEWREGALRSLPGLSLDALLAIPADLARAAIQRSLGAELDPAAVEALAPAESQEVWAAGVTYRRSREARHRLRSE